MGKLLVTSNISHDNKLFAEFTALKISKQLKGNFGEITAYKKININTNNYAQIGENWIIGTGTYVYKDKIDEEALFFILKYLIRGKSNIEESLLEIRKQILGSYSLVIGLDENVFIIIDNLDSYNLYYYLNDNEFIMTNTWYHVNKGKSKPSKIDAKQFAEYFCKIDNIYDRTPYKDIRRLDECHYIQYSNNKWCEKLFKSKKISFHGDFWKEILKDYKSIEIAMKKIGISYTGGLDSRMNLALLLAINGKPKLYYGVGNTRETNTKEIDQHIFEETVKRYNLESSIMNWNETETNNYEDNIEKYGELASLYASNNNFFNEYYNNIDVNCMLYGYGGEYLRNNDYRAEKEFNLKWYIDTYFDNYLISSLKEKDEYLNEVYNLILEFCHKRDIDENHISRNDMTILNYSVKRGTSTRMCNFTNLFEYSCLMLPNASLLYLANQVPYEERENGKFMIKGINNVFPDCLEIPIFSRHVLRTIDKVTFELKNQQKKLEGIRKVLGRSDLKYKNTLIRKIYFVLKGDKKGLEELLQEEKLKKNYKDIVQSKLVDSLFDRKKINRVIDGSSLVRLFIALKIIGQEK